MAVKGKSKKPLDNIDRSKANDPAVMEYRAAAIEAREADARFAAAEARIANTIAAADEEYKASAAAAAAAARSAVSIAKTDGADIDHFEGDREKAEIEFQTAVSLKNAAEERMNAAQKALHKDEELAALAYVLAKEDSFEKEIAMSLLEETEIQILSKKYNTSDAYTRAKYRKEKLAVQGAEAEAEEIKSEKKITELEAGQAKKKAEKLANYIAEYEEFNDVGLVDKMHKELAEDAKKQMQAAMLHSIETQKELEKLTRQLAEEEQELEAIREKSEIYMEIQDRITDPLTKAELAKNRGDKLPSNYKEKFSEVVDDATELAIQLKELEEKRKSIARNNTRKKRWGAFKIICGLAISASSVYFIGINLNEYLRFAVPCFIGGMSMIGFGVKEWEDQTPDISIDGVQGSVGQSLTTSLSKSLIDSITQTQSRS